MEANASDTDDGWGFRCDPGAHLMETAAQTTRPSASAGALSHREALAALECAVELATAASAMNCEEEMPAGRK